MFASNLYSMFQTVFQLSWILSSLKLLNAAIIRAFNPPLVLEGVFYYLWDGPINICVCVYVRVRVCVYKCMCTYVYVCVYVCIYTRICLCVCMHNYICMYIFENHRKTKAKTGV